MMRKSEKSSLQTFVLGVFITRLGDSFSFLAFILVLLDQPSSHILVSLFMVAHYLPGVLMGLFGKHLFHILTLNTKNSLVVCYSFSAFGTALACFALSSPFVLLALSLLLGISYGLYVPLQKAYAAELFPLHEIKAANTALQMAEVLAKSVGFAAAGLLFEHLGALISFSLDAFSFLVIALIVALSVPHEKIRQLFEPSVRNEPTHQKMLTRELMFNSSVFAWAWLGTGILFALEASYAKAYLEATDTMVGILFACATIGSLCSPLIAGRVPSGRERTSLFWICLLEMLFVGGYGLSSSLMGAIFCIVGYGFMLTTRHLILVSWIHVRVPQQDHGKTFAFQQAWSNLAMMLGMGASGFVALVIGLRETLTAGVVISVLAIVLTRIILPAPQKE